MVTVTGQAQRITGRGRVIRDPKSDAGLRTVAVPSVVMSALTEHMATYTGSTSDAWVFTAHKGGSAREAHLRAAWDRAAAECGVPGAHLHDLRHFGATFAAQFGATTRELQSRLGHSTTRAAMLYQHRSQNRDQELADRMDASLNERIERRTGRH